MKIELVKNTVDTVYCIFNVKCNINKKKKRTTRYRQRQFDVTRRRNKLGRKKKGKNVEVQPEGGEKRGNKEVDYNVTPVTWRLKSISASSRITVRFLLLDLLDNKRRSHAKWEKNGGLKRGEKRGTCQRFFLLLICLERFERRRLPDKSSVLNSRNTRYHVNKWNSEIASLESSSGGKRKIKERVKERNARRPCCVVVYFERLKGAIVYSGRQRVTYGRVVYFYFLLFYFLVLFYFLW